MDKKKQKRFCQEKIEFNSKKFNFFDINNIEMSLVKTIKKLPYAYKILLENLVRNLNGSLVKEEDILNIIKRKIDNLYSILSFKNMI